MELRGNPPHALEQVDEALLTLRPGFLEPAFLLFEGARPVVERLLSGAVLGVALPARLELALPPLEGCSPVGKHFACLSQRPSSRIEFGLTLLERLLHERESCRSLLVPPLGLAVLAQPSLGPLACECELVLALPKLRGVTLKERTNVLRGVST